MLYKISNGSVVLGNKTILEEINFEIKDCERVAIVGRNGCGKTTLLKAIMNQVSMEAGLSEDNFSIIKFGVSNIGYIEQNAIVDDEITLLDEILKSYDEILKAEEKIKKIEFDLENNYSEKLLNKYQDLQFYYQTIGGYIYKKEYELALSKFGFSSSDKLKKIKEFSFGQRTKIAFLRLLLSKPDLLLLDEPTNHLDVLAIEWLENFLANYPKMLIVVSHDRMFLDSVCNVVYEIEYGNLTKYSGNYSYYEKQKKLDYDKQLYDFERQKKEIERLKGIADRFRYKPNKASMALSKLKQIERMAKIVEPKRANTKTFPSRFEILEESYRDVLKVKNLKIGYDKVLGEVNLELERGERLGIIGENGTGKSTFLKTILGIIPSLGGKFIFGNRVSIGYFDQNVESLCADDTVLEVMTNEFPLVDVLEIRSILGAFEFYGDMVFLKVKELSGGQKVKLLLCKIMMYRPNVLILDEVTNHLDIIGKCAIEDLLLQYKGTIIFISHDRYFVKKIATNLLVFENGGVNYYNGDYDYYLKNREVIEGLEDFDNGLVKKEKSKKYVSDLKEKSRLERQIRKIETEIDKLENQIKVYNLELIKEEVYMDFDKSREIQDEIQKVELILNQKMQEWEILSIKIDC